MEDVLALVDQLRNRLFLLSEQAQGSDLLLTFLGLKQLLNEQRKKTVVRVLLD